MGAAKIVVLGTGGTIAGTAAQPGDNLGYAAAQLSVAQLVDDVPALAGAPLHAEQVAQVDSKDMDHTIWQHLAGRCAHWLVQADVQGLVITHGTDTLEETAFFLQQVLAPSKPVVLACAMRPATALLADGPQNLSDAVAVARSPGAQGVVAVCAGRVHGPLEVSKQHPYRLDPFDSGEAGPLAFVEEGVVRVVRPWPGADAAAPARLQAVLAARTWPRVEIVMNHVGASGALVDALVMQGVDGLVVAGTGNGSVASPMEQALLQAQAQGVRVVRSTRCTQGRVLPHAADRLPDSQGLSAVKARVALLLALLAVQRAD